MKNKLFLLPLISLLSLSACSKVNYEPGSPLIITSIEMIKEYGLDSTIRILEIVLRD